MTLLCASSEFEMDWKEDEVKEDELVQMEQHGHPKQCKEKKGGINYFDFCCLIVCRSADRIAAAIGIIWNDMKKKEDENIERCWIWECGELENEN